MVVILYCREKPLAMCVYGPYPKPTQVVRLKILRRSGELWLRNSAKCPRNFGRRGTTLGDTTHVVEAGGGRREERGATVYQKHRSVRRR